MLELILRFILAPLILGGGIWKGAETLSNALSKRAEAKTATARLDFEQIQANYQNAMALIEQQAKRIDVLTNKVERYEQRIDELTDKVDRKEAERDQMELEYTEKIKTLEIAVEQLHKENLRLKRELKTTQAELETAKCNYSLALERIRKLEEGDTGPLKE